MAKKSTITVVVVRPGQPAVAEEIENTLEAEQSIVGGYIEPHELPDGCYFVANEEGRLIGLPDNREVYPYGMIVGTFFITRDNKAGDFVSLTKAQQQKYLKLYS